MITILAAILSAAIASPVEIRVHLEDHNRRACPSGVCGVIVLTCDSVKIESVVTRWHGIYAKVSPGVLRWRKHETETPVWGMRITDEHKASMDEFSPSLRMFVKLLRTGGDPAFNVDIPWPAECSR